MKTTTVIFLSAILIISVVFAEDQGKNSTTNVTPVHNNTLVMTDDNARFSRHFGGEDKKGGGNQGGGGYGYGYGYPPPPMPCCPCYGGGGYPYYG